MDEEIDYELTIAQFMTSTGSDDYNKAYEYLGKNDWNVDNAVSKFIEDNPVDFYKQYSNDNEKYKTNNNKKQTTLLDEIRGINDTDYYKDSKSSSLNSNKRVGKVDINKNDNKKSDSNKSNVTSTCKLKNEVNEMIGLPFEKDINSVSKFIIYLVQKFY